MLYLSGWYYSILGDCVIVFMDRKVSISLEQHIFAFLIITEGTTGKALQFIMPLKSIYMKNLGFITQKMYFCTLQRGSNHMSIK